jgi:hypothetical protein
MEPSGPALRYVEYHLTEHCNLDCKGCGHFSPFAAEAYGDPASFDRDLAQLSRLFGHIGRIRLMGGEPLLHPEPWSFVRVARHRFPSADLRIVTNGILLKKMDERFWASCREADVTIDISLYPALQKSHATFQELCDSYSVKTAITPVNSFFVGLNPRNDSDPQEAMNYCRTHFYCPFLHNSRLYVCALPVVAHYFNDRFDRSIPDDGGIDIFAEGMTGGRVLELLDQPVDTCRSCSCSWKEVQWLHAPAMKHTLQDYEV